MFCKKKTKKKLEFHFETHRRPKGNPAERPTKK